MLIRMEGRALCFNPVGVRKGERNASTQWSEEGRLSAMLGPVLVQIRAIQTLASVFVERVGLEAYCGKKSEFVLSLRKSLAFMDTLAIIQGHKCNLDGPNRRLCLHCRAEDMRVCWCLPYRQPISNYRTQPW